jgi:hypothetical protein
MEAEPPKADAPNRKRRWFQFSLRTLMIVVALVAMLLGYVGSQVRIVKERNGLRDAIVRNGGFVALNPPTGMGEIPWLRQCLGDRAAGLIGVPKGAEFDYEYDLSKRLFPEATIDRVELPMVR